MPMGLIPKPEDNWPTWLVIIYYVILVAAGVGFVAYMVFKSFRYMKRGQAGIKTRRGVPRINSNGEYLRVGPGIHPIIPFLDNIESTSVLLRVTEEIASVLAENKRTQFVGAVKPSWRVLDTHRDLHDALFLADDVKDVVEIEVMCAVAEAIEEAGNPCDRRKVAQRALELCSKTLRGYGVEIAKIGLVSVTRTPVQVLGDTLGSRSNNTWMRKLAGALAHSLGFTNAGSV